VIRIRCRSLTSSFALALPADDAKVVATLARNDELVVVGEQKNGYINVQRDRRRLGQGRARHQTLVVVRGFSLVR
jgi:hypothetical protein